VNAQMKPDERGEWLEARRHGIGGSDAPAIVGVSPWRTPLDVYVDKIGEGLELEDNPAMAWGRALEPVIRQAYSDRTGRAVRLPGMLAHPKHEWMLGNLDGITDDQRVLEIKTARTAQGWGEEGSDMIPLPYLIQVQHYMAVTAFPVADVAVLIGGSDFRLYEVPADADLQAQLIDAEAEFWKRVEAREPPEPITLAEAKTRFGRSSAAGEVEASPAVFTMALALQGFAAEIKALEGKADECRAALMKALGEKGDTLTHKGRVLATWKLAKAPQRFDTKAFAEAHPDLHAQFTHPGEPSRRLLLKDISQ